MARADYVKTGNRVGRPNVKPADRKVHVALCMRLEDSLLLKKQAEQAGMITGKYVTKLIHEKE